MEGNDSNNESGTEPQRRLFRNLDHADSIGQELVRLGLKIAADGQRILDWSRATRSAVSLLPGAPFLDTLNASWELTNRQAGLMVHHLSNVETSSTASLTNTSASTLVSYVVPALWTEAADPARKQVAEDAITTIQDLASRPEEGQRVRELLTTFGLDVACGNERSPLQQFETAHRAFETTIDESMPAVTSLVPMRSCIETMIDLLLKRRPRQEKARSIREKVLSIGTQMRHESIPDAHLDRLACQCHNLLDRKLSRAKHKTISRREWQSSLLTATLWIRAFLEAIDSAKMKIGKA